MNQPGDPLPAFRTRKPPAPVVADAVPQKKPKIVPSGRNPASDFDVYYTRTSERLHAGRIVVVKSGVSYEAHVKVPGKEDGTWEKAGVFSKAYLAIEDITKRHRALMEDDDKKAEKKAGANGIGGQNGQASKVTKR